MKIVLKIETIKPVPNITAHWQRPGDVPDVSKLKKKLDDISRFDVVEIARVA
jgi:hypothetical protein